MWPKLLHPPAGDTGANVLGVAAFVLLDADACNSPLSLAESADGVIDPDACSSSARLGAGAGELTVVANVFKRPANNSSVKFLISLITAFSVSSVFFCLVSCKLFSSVATDSNIGFNSAVTVFNRLVLNSTKLNSLSALWNLSIFFKNASSIALVFIDSSLTFRSISFMNFRLSVVAPAASANFESTRSWFSMIVFKED